MTTRSVLSSQELAKSAIMDMNVSCTLMPLIFNTPNSSCMQLFDAKQLGIAQCSTLVLRPVATSLNGAVGRGGLGPATGHATNGAFLCAPALA